MDLLADMNLNVLRADITVKIIHSGVRSLSAQRSTNNCIYCNSKEEGAERKHEIFSLKRV